MNAKFASRTSVKSIALIAACAAICPSFSYAADFWWRGDINSTWNSTLGVSPAITDSNFATTSAGTTDSLALPTSADIVRFATSNAANLSTTLGQNFSIAGLTTESSLTGDVVISGNTLTLGTSGITTNVNRTLSISSAVNGASILPFNISSGTVSLNSAVTLGVINKTGSGRLIFDGQNKFATALNVSAGTVDLVGFGTMSTNAVITVNNSGTLRFTGSDTWGGHAAISSSPITINAGATVASSGFYNTLVNLNFNGGTLALNGGQTPEYPAFALKGTVSVTGSSASNVTVGSGINNTITLGSTASPGSTIFNVSDVTGNVNPDLTIAAPLIDIRNNPGTAAQPATLIKSGLGTLTLTAANTYSGGTTVSAGILEFSGAGNTLNSAPITINSGGTLRLSRNDTWGAFSTTTSPAVTINSGGVLASNNSFNTLVNLNLNGGTLLLNGGSSSTFPAFALKGTVTVGGSAASTFSNGIGSNNFINIGTTAAPGSTTFNVADSTSNANPDLTINVPLQNSISDSTAAALTSGLIKTGAGTLRLAAANTYTGATTVNAGVLEIGSGGFIPTSSSIVVNNGGTFRFARADVWGNHTTTTTAPVTINAGGTVASSGQYNVLVNLNLNGGTLLLNGGATANFPAFGLKGTVTVGGSTPSNISVGTGSNNAITIGSSATPDSTIFSVADVTGNASPDLIISAPIQDIRNNPGSAVQPSTLFKSGDGTLVLGGDNTYSGGTFISAGTVQVGNGGSTGSILGNATINGQLVFNRTGTSTFPGNTTGSGSLTKVGSGTLILTGSNSYAGSTNVNEGTLQIGNGATSGTVPGNIANNGNVTFNRGDIVNFLSLISGAGSVTQAGSGTLIFSTNQPYTGGTTVSAGTLQLGNGGNTGSVIGNITNNGNVAFSRSDNLTYSNVISGSGSLAKLGANTLTLTGDNTFSGVTTISAGTLQLGNGGTTGSIVGNIVNNSSLVTNRSNALTLPGNISGTGTITMANAGGDLTLTGTNTSTGNITMSAIFPSAKLNIGNGGSTGSIVANVITGSSTNKINFNSSANSTYPGVISGPGQIEKLGAGTLTLTGNNTYTDVTIVTAGTLEIGNGGTTGSVAGIIGNFGTVIFNRSDSFTRTNGLGGPGNVIKRGAGTLTLDSINNIDGILTIAEGTLTTTSTSGLGNPSAITFTGGTYRFTPGANIDLSNNNISNSTSDIRIDTTGVDAIFGAAIGSSNTGGLTKLGSGTLTFWGANTYTGTTTLTSGSLQIGNGATQGSLVSNVVANGQLIFNRSDASTYPGVISGSGLVTKLGTGTLTLTGNSTSSPGTLTIFSGTVQIGNGGTTGFISGSITNNAALIFNRSDDITYPGIVSGSGSLTKLGSGVLTLAFPQNYAGGTTITEGTLQIGDGGPSGFITGNITNNADLIFNRAGDYTHPGLITGTGTLTKLALGTLTFAPGQAAPYQMSELTITDGAIDLSDNDLIIDYTGSSPLATLNDYIANSQLLASPDVSGVSTLMVLFEASDIGLTEYSGVTVDSDTVIGKFTFIGDANLDGQVDSFDYSIIDDNFGQAGSFINGDLNGDGVIDAFDYSAIDDTFGAGVGNPLRPSASTEVFIPEPSGLALVGAAGLMLVRRRRTNN